MRSGWVERGRQYETVLARLRLNVAGVASPYRPLRCRCSAALLISCTRMPCSRSSASACRVLRYTPRVASVKSGCDEVSCRILSWRSSTVEWKRVTHRDYELAQLGRSVVQYSGYDSDYAARLSSASAMMWFFDIGNSLPVLIARKSVRRCRYAWLHQMNPPSERPMLGTVWDGIQQQVNRLRIRDRRGVSF